MSIYNNKLFNIIKVPKNISNKFIVRNKETFDLLMSVCYWDDEYREAIFCYKNNLQKHPGCENCGDITKFDGKRYNQFCNKKECIEAKKKTSSSKEARLKKEQTNIERYGFAHPMQSEEIHKKQKTTFEKKYGGHPWSDKEVRKKIEKTNIKRYGFSNPSKSNKIKEKRKQIWIKNYGVENPMKCKKFKEKRELTWLKIYNCRNPMSVKKIKDKRDYTLVKRYGKNPFKNPKIKQKTRNTLLKRYGVTHNMHIPDVCERSHISGKRFKKHKSIKEKEYLVQGYEGYAINILESCGVVFVNRRKDVGFLKYFNNKNRIYYPDLKLCNSNTFIEVKSTYTLINSYQKMIDVYECNKNIKLHIWLFENNRFNDPIIIKNKEELILWKQGKEDIKI